MKRKHLVVLSGAGVSADSGLETFRDSDGLWAKYRIDILIIVGTSLAVYPAAGLVRYVPRGAHIYVVDPSGITLSRADVTFIRERSVTGMPKLLKLLI